MTPAEREAQLERIAEYLLAHNKVHFNELIKAEKGIISISVEGGSWAQQDDTRTRARAENFASKVSRGQAELFVKQIVDRTVYLDPSMSLLSVDNNPAKRARMEAHVMDSILQGFKWDEKKGTITRDKDKYDEKTGTWERIGYGSLTFFGNDETWMDYANLEVARRQKEQTIDPTMFLIEHKLKEVLMETVEKSYFGEDSLAIATIIMGDTPLIDAGFPAIDVTSSEYDDVKKRVVPQLENIFGTFTETMYEDMEDFNSGSLTSFFDSRLHRAPENYFDYLVEPPDTSGVDARLFVTDEKERRKILNKWIGELGGISDPSNKIHALDDFEIKAHGDTNRDLIGTENKFGLLGDITNKYFQEGKVLDWVPKAAIEKNQEPFQFVLESVKDEFDQYFMPDVVDTGPIIGIDQGEAIDTGITEKAPLSWYELRVQQEARILRQQAYEDPSKAGTALKNELFGKKDYWVDDIPVDAKRVSPEVWADWTHFVTEYGLSAALTYIVPQLQSAVGSFKMSSFDRDKAEAQAKDFFKRKSIKWADIPMEQQQVIISQIETRGGMDVERAVRLPSTGNIGIDPNEQIDAGITADPEALFGESLKEFATGIVDKQAEMKSFQQILNNPLSLIYDVFKEKNILNPDVSTAFMENLDRNVAPIIARKVAAGQYSSINEIRQEIESQIETLPAYDVSGIDYDRQTGSEMPSFPSGALPAFRAKPQTPKFDVAGFTPELQEIGMENPELAGFVQQQMMVPGFEKEWQQAAQRQLRHDREADQQLQEDRLSSFQSAYDRAVAGGDESVIAQAQANLDSAQAQFDRETGASFTTYAVDPATLGVEGAPFLPAETVKRFYSGLDPVEKSIRGKIVPTGTVSTTGIQQEGLFGATGQYVTPAGQPGEGTVFNIYGPAQQQTLAGMAKMMTTPGMTQQQFFESKLPGFQQRFEASPFFTQQQKRLEQEEVTQQRRTEAEEKAEERAAESKRRSMLRGSSALSVFSRRQ